MPLHLPFRTDQDHFPSEGIDSKLGGIVSQSLQVQPWMGTSACFWEALNINSGHSLCAGVKPPA